MPQTCYEPPYGCYHGSRWNTIAIRAFHGTYYRKAYNYRNYFDYPWHAEMHEPTSEFSFHVTGDTGAPGQLPPVVAPEGAGPEAENSFLLLRSPPRLVRTAAGGGGQLRCGKAETCKRPREIPSARCGGSLPGRHVRGTSRYNVPLCPISLARNEAGYGPNLGPLVIGASVWEVPPETRLMGSTIC